MDFRRIKQVCKYGWKDAQSLSQEDDAQKGRIVIFLDILYCFFKYNVWSNQFKKEKLHLVNSEQKKIICLKYQVENNKRDNWVKGFFDNYKFLNKWSSFKYERSADLQAKRRAAYTRYYNLGKANIIGYDVILHRHHYVYSIIETGPDCLIAEHANIDYTGGLVLGEQVAISEGAKIFTHNHSIYGDTMGRERKELILTPLVIEDNAWIGSRALIMPGVGRIGRRSIVAAGTVLRHSVPSYAIVMGNPSRIVGFSLTPEQVEEYEKEKYPKERRIDIEKYKKDYNKLFVEKMNEIKDYLKKTC